MISDNGLPTMTGTSMLTVIIGDQNDNAMKSGQSSIFVYNYRVSVITGSPICIFLNDILIE